MNEVTAANGTRIPKIGIGTWNMGGRMVPDESQNERVLASLRYALEIGYNHIDTAEMYAGGHTETLVGQAIEGHERANLFITTKVWHTNLGYDQVLNACEGSLRRLNTEYIDLYLIHWPSSTGTPLAETIKGLNALVSKGFVRNIGVSNFDLPLLEKAVSLSEAPITTNQVPYSLHTRKYAQNGVMNFCQENDIAFTAYTPVEKGRLADDTVLNQVAESHGASPVQVALALLFHQENVIAIPMSMNPKHIQMNLDALNIELSVEDLQRLEHNQ